MSKVGGGDAFPTGDERDGWTVGCDPPLPLTARGRKVCVIDFCCYETLRFLIILLYRVTGKECNLEHLTMFLVK